jgi:capsular exopolysaccharide synthesis family protein
MQRVSPETSTGMVLRKSEDLGPVYEFREPAAEVHSPVRHYWTVLSHRRNDVLACCALALVLVAIYTFRMKPVYQATARVDIESEAPPLQTLNEAFQNLHEADEVFLKTQVKVLQSENLAWQTIQALDLANNPDFAPKNFAKKHPDPVDARGILLQEFFNHLNVRLSPNSRIVEVSFESTSRQLTATVVNSIVDAYTEYNFRTAYDATRQTSGWMEQRLDELKAKVERSQQALVDYERQNSIVNVDEKETVVEQRLGDLSKDLTTAESDLAKRQSEYALITENPGQSALIAQDELLEHLQEQSADLQQQVADATSVYGVNYPKVQRLKSQFDSVQALVERERSRVLERSKRDFETAKLRVNLLRNSVTNQKGEVGRLNQLQIQHNILKREFDSNQQLYLSLLQRLKDATVTAGLRSANVHIVDRATPPSKPIRPRKLLNLATGLLIGFIFGITVAFIREGVDYSVKTPEDVEQLIGVATLSIIPTLSEGLRVYGYGKRPAATSNGLKPSPVALTMTKSPGSPVAEAYRILRTSILFSTPSHPPQAILVCSAKPKEGKTSTVLNLAQALAERGGRVVVVDSDLRIPGLTKNLNLSHAPGLSGVLAGAYGIDEALIQTDLLPGVMVIPAGPRSPNPAELLSSSAIESTIAELRKRFDHIILDSPPLLLVTDATMLSALVDGVVLVVESGSTSRVALIRCRSMLKVAGARLLGVAMNKVSFRRDSDYSYYGSSYYYADESDDHTEDTEQAVGGVSSGQR